MTALICVVEATAHLNLYHSDGFAFFNTGLAKSSLINGTWRQMWHPLCTMSTFLCIDPNTVALRMRTQEVFLHVNVEGFL